MFEDRDFETILSEMLAMAGDDIDTSEGSIFYDAAAPAAMQLAALYTSLSDVINEIFPDTASEEYLILHAAEAGLSRGEASSSVIVGGFDTEIDEGTRFILGKYTYVSGGEADYADAVDGYFYYELTCETAGSATSGNSVGTLVPASYIDGLTYAEALGLISAGEDEESVESLRSRVISAMRFPAFGGNIASYRNYVDAFEKVGGVRIYPAYNGGGTVKVVIISSGGGAPDEEVVKEIKESLDPSDSSGEGMGYAPIGHAVTVVGAEEYAVTVKAAMTFEGDWTFDTAKSYLEEAVAAYIDDLAANWESSDSTTVRISKIESCLLDTGLLEDISDTQLYDISAGEYVSTNIVLSSDEIPIFGSVEDANGTTDEETCETADEEA